jgi:four helix bundle protein
MRENILKEKSYRFALRMIRLHQYLRKRGETVLSRQLLRSGTAIGASVRESEFAQSKADFVHKLHIALKEANETEYWLSLLKDSELLTEKMYRSVKPEIDELISLLVTIVKSAKTNMKEKTR